MKAKLWVFVLVALVGSVLTHHSLLIYDRFKDDETSYAFYSDEAYATCVVLKDSGQVVMSCIPGKRFKDKTNEPATP